MKVEQVRKLQVTEIRYIKAIRGVTTQERTRNEDIRKEIKVVK